MENKVLVKVLVPELERTFDVFIPVNELVWRVRQMIIKVVSDLTGIGIDQKSPSILINKSSNNIYTNNQVIIDTDIRNGTELILILKK